MLHNLATYRAKSFVAERNMTSMAYEVKRTRAVWDASLRIPGTDRSGGWRCPVGTRYGGQITDRFGRNCGWGVARRLANEISDLGERLENVGDRRRGRRLERRNRNMVQRLQGQGRLERAAGRVAEALEPDTSPNRPAARAVTPRPAAPRRQRQGQVARRRRGNLRDSELRRMDREIDQPGAPRTGEIDRQPVNRPRPAAPRARRRRALVDNTQNRPADAVDQEREPAKKAAAKKAPAKKAAAKKAAPAKKAAKKRVPAKKAPVKKAAAQKAPAERVPASRYNPDDAPMGDAAGEAERIRGLSKEQFAPDNARLFAAMTDKELGLLEGLNDEAAISVRTGNGYRDTTVGEHRRNLEDLRAAYQEIIDYHDARGGNALTALRENNKPEANAPAVVVQEASIPNKPEPAVDLVGEERLKKAKEKVDAAIKKHQRRLAEYLNERYGEGNAPWKEMTPERFGKLVNDLYGAPDVAQNAKQELEKWAKDMFTHPEIKGANGETYRITGGVGIFARSRPPVINWGGTIERKSGDRWIQVGRTSREFKINLADPKKSFVYNATMFIDNEADKGAGLATIYNHHAFMYQKAAGFKKVKVRAAADGPYVWGRFGYRSKISDSNISNARNEVANFRAGRSRVIKNEQQARIWEALIEEHEKWKRSGGRRRQPYRHMDFIYAIDVEDKAHGKDIRNWFVLNFRMPAGEFIFAENGIIDDPRELR